MRFLWPGFPADKCCIHPDSQSSYINLLFSGFDHSAYHRNLLNTAKFSRFISLQVWHIQSFTSIWHLKKVARRKGTFSACMTTGITGWASFQVPIGQFASCIQFRKYFSNLQKWLKCQSDNLSLQLQASISLMFFAVFSCLHMII